MKKLFYIFFVMLGVLLFQLANSARAQTFERYAAHNSYQVIAPSGMNMREAPSTSAKVIAKVPRGETVTMMDEEGKQYGQLTVDGIPAHWVKAKHNQTEGYIFSGYFYQEMEQPTPEHKDYMIAFEGDSEFNSHHFDPNFHWYGIYEHEGTYSVKKVAIHFEGDAFQSMATDQKEGSRVLIGSRKKLPLATKPKRKAEGLVDQFGGQMNPGDQVLMNFNYEGNTSYEMLSVLGKVSLSEYSGLNEMSGEPYVGTKISGYTLLLTRFGANGDYESQNHKFIQFPKDLYESFWLVWYGDLDGDGFMDIITEGVGADFESEVVLYLSSEAASGKLIKRVASLNMWGGC